MKKLVVLTGAGISAESGLKTFRDSDGLWEQYRLEDVATPTAWRKNPDLVLEFYNQRRKKLHEAEPNRAHFSLAGLEKHFEVRIITQNIDDLHERAGSTRVLHLHGELKKARSTADPSLVYEIDGWELNPGNKCEKGSQLRPHIVWFGEPVPLFEEAIRIASEAEILLVIGTSMLVYPAASLIDFVPVSSPKFYIDPKAFNIPHIRNLEIVCKIATEGVPEVAERLVKGEI